MNQLARISLVLLFALMFSPLAQAQFGVFDDPVEEAGGLGDETVMRIRIGVIVRAVGGPCNGLFATVPVPMEWPEQEVKIIEEDLTRHIGGIDYRYTNEAARQMLIKIPNIPAGDSAHALITFEVTRREILAPENLEGFTIPKDLPLDMRQYLGHSPYIEVRHDEIRDVSRELLDEDLPAWEQTEIIYDWVRDHVEYTNGPLKGALAALRDGDGDCEELTSLFIAICRNNEIPARTVWVPGHCYPEFYLNNEEGEGVWIPCQAAGTRQFGSMTEARIILQKGDNFRVPEKRERQRYIAEYLRGNTSRGGGQPEVQFVQSHVPVN